MQTNTKAPQTGLKAGLRWTEETRSDRDVLVTIPESLPVPNADEISARAHRSHLTVCGKLRRFVGVWHLTNRRNRFTGRGTKVAMNSGRRSRRFDVGQK